MHKYVMARVTSPGSHDSVIVSHSNERCRYTNESIGCSVLKQASLFQRWFGIWRQAVSLTIIGQPVRGVNAMASRYDIKVVVEAEEEGEHMHVVTASEVDILGRSCLIR